MRWRGVNRGHRLCAFLTGRGRKDAIADAPDGPMTIAGP